MKTNVQFIWNQGTALGRIRAELNSIEQALMRGPRRGAPQAKASWQIIAQEASNQATALNSAEPKKRTVKPKVVNEPELLKETPGV